MEAGTRPTRTASATAARGVWIATRAGDETTGHLRAMAAARPPDAPEVADGDPVMRVDLVISSRLP